jgi:Raf kinase inhibitor-like YbhB/YbcL family protein
MEATMNLVHTIGELLRPIRSGEDKLLEAKPEVATQNQSISVRSSAFAEGAPMPVQYSEDGSGDFPPIQWTNVPDGTKSFVLVVEDPDIPKATPFVHGIFYNIPADVMEIATSDVVGGKPAPLLVSKGVKMGTNTLFKAEYLSPTPPPGHGPHHYHFELLALDKMLDFDKEPTLADIRKEIENHVFAFGILIGVYERK